MRAWFVDLCSDLLVFAIEGTIVVVFFSIWTATLVWIGWKIALWLGFGSVPQ